MLCGKGEMGRFSFCKCIGQLYLIQLHNLQDNINITAASASFQTQSLRKEKSNLSMSEKGAGWERSAEYEPEHQEEQRFSPLTHRIQNKNLTSLDISKHIAQRWGTNPQCVKLACVFFSFFFFWDILSERQQHAQLSHTTCDTTVPVCLLVRGDSFIVHLDTLTPSLASS